VNSPAGEQEENQGGPEFKKRLRERVPIGEGATAGDLQRACESEEQDGSKERDREGVQVKRIGKVAAKSGTGGACASTEKAGEAG